MSMDITRVPYREKWQRRSQQLSWH